MKTKQELKTENDKLRTLLIRLRLEAQAVVDSRMSKEINFPAGGEYGLGYRTCCHEAFLRMREVIASSVSEEEEAL